MNKKQRPSKKGRKQAALGLVVCFVAAIALTGVYTWSNYKDRTQKELELAKAVEQAREDSLKNAAEEANSIASKAEDVQEEKDTQAQVPSEAPNETQKSTQTAGNTSQINFSEESQLLWPVNGNVIMSYSMDKTVYFSTLDQYKYNPAVIISGAVNDNVISAAPGIVKSIDIDPQTGNTVTLDMGNGYECIYGQLKEVPVKVGDYVESGAVLGYLSEPTKYYSVEGCNLYFEMRKDGQPVNPMDYMAEE